MHYRSFSLDKFKNKVGRRASEPSLFELAHDRRDSNPTIVVSEDVAASTGGDPGVGPILTGTNGMVSIHPSANTNTSGSYGSYGPSGHASGASSASRLRAQSLSLMHTSRSRSRSRSRSVNQAPVLGTKKNTKELIKHETALVVLKKIAHVLQELGLQNPIPLKTTNNSFNGSASKSAKIYVANANDCIYLAPASSASFTYEDVENGGGIPETSRSAEALRAADDLLQRNDSASSDAESSIPSYFPDDSTTAIDEDSFLATSLADQSAESIDGLGNPGLRSRLLSFNSPNYLCTKIDSDTPIPHTFAVIIELIKDTASVKDVKFQFQSLTNILWPSSDPYNKTFLKEQFRIGHMEWFTSLKDADFYINTTDSNDVKFKKVLPDDLAKRTRDYKLLNVRDVANGEKNNGSDPEISANISQTSSSSTDNYKAGLYVFLLPILLPEHIPPTITSINGSLNHKLGVSFTKNSDKFNRKIKVSGSFNLPMVRTPPSFANSIADKPIYVNRVWNNAIHYIITFPKKYVSLGSEHVINVKLVPLVKDVIVKRIKFNVLERITYVSKSLSREYEYDSEDPYYLRPLNPDSKHRERVVTLCELKTKAKTGSSAAQEPYKEEVIKCPDNNLLFVCYELEKNEDTMIASPLDINIALPFLTTKADKMAPDDEILSPPSNLTSRKASIVETSPFDGNRVESPGPFTPSSPIIGALETNLSHGHSVNSENESLVDLLTPSLSNYMSDDHLSTLQPSENIQMGYTTASKALAPDSNFRHIQVNHRLQVCFRISKPDPNDNGRMHHYEVVVDTPLILVSAKCNEESVQLPEYDEINGIRTESSSKVLRNGIEIRPLGEETDEQLPSFEEATSPMSSPITRSVSIAEDPLSRIPSISGASGPPPLGHSIFNPAYLPRDPAPAYDSAGYEPSVYDGVEQIDRVVNEASPLGNRRQSRLRSSLVNSFAKTEPKSDNASDPLDLEADPVMLDVEVDPHILDPLSSLDLDPLETSSDPNNVSSSSQSSQQVQDSEENNLTTPTTSIAASNEVTDNSCTDPEPGSLQCNSMNLEAPQSPSTGQSLSTGITTEENVLSKSNDDDSLVSKDEEDDNVSMFTQDTSANFAQRLPLLQHISTEQIFTTSSRPPLLHSMTSTTTNTTLPIREEGEKDSPDNVSLYLADNMTTTEFSSKPPEFQGINKYLG